MPKPNPLTQGLEKQASARVSPSTPPAQTVPKASPRSSRFGRVLVGGHFAPEVQTALKVIAAEERTTVQALLAEGINTVFARRHKPEIAAVLPTP
jgi:hypothetical protein